MIFVIDHSPIAQQFNYLYYCFEISSFFVLCIIYFCNNIIISDGPRDTKDWSNDCWKFSVASQEYI